MRLDSKNKPRIAGCKTDADCAEGQECYAGSTMNAACIAKGLLGMGAPEAGKQQGGMGGKQQGGMGGKQQGGMGGKQQGGMGDKGGAGCGGKDGGMAGGKDGGMAGGKDGGMAGGKDGGMAGGKDGGMAGGKDGAAGSKDGSAAGSKDGGATADAGGSKGGGGSKGAAGPDCCWQAFQNFGCATWRHQFFEPCVHLASFRPCNSWASFLNWSNSRQYKAPINNSCRCVDLSLYGSYE